MVMKELMKERSVKNFVPIGGKNTGYKKPDRCIILQLDKTTVKYCYCAV